MNADTAFSGRTRNASSTRQHPVELADSILDRLSIARCLLLQEPISCRLSLVLRILNTTCDDVATLAGERVEQERRDREAESIARAAAPRPRRKRTILELLDAVAFVGIVGLALIGAAAWIAASVAIRLGWL